MEYFIGLDIGTSAVKGALLSEDGRLITVTDKKFEYEDEGTFRLLDPEDFCKRCFDVIRDLSDKADGRIAAVCFCHASGNPLYERGAGRVLPRRRLGLLQRYARRRSCVHKGT